MADKESVHPESAQTTGQHASGPTRYAANDLAYKINPIFSFENDGRCLWNMPQAEYDILKPALRLAQPF